MVLIIHLDSGMYDITIPHHSKFPFALCPQMADKLLGTISNVLRTIQLNLSLVFPLYN